MEPTNAPNAIANAAPASLAAVNNTDDDTLQIHTYTDATSGMPIVAAIGDIDLCTTPTLRDALQKVFGQPATGGVAALDMREVGFIDSAGLALLVEIRKGFYEKTKLALLVQKGSQPERVLRLGRFDTFLKVGYQPEDVLSGAVTPATTAA